MWTRWAQHAGSPREQRSRTCSQRSEEARWVGTGSWNRFVQDGCSGSGELDVATGSCVSGWLNKWFAACRVTGCFPFGDKGKNHFLSSWLSSRPVRGRRE